MAWANENPDDEQLFSFLNGSEAASPLTRMPDSTVQRALSPEFRSFLGAMAGGALVALFAWIAWLFS